MLVRWACTGEHAKKANPVRRHPAPSPRHARSVRGSKRIAIPNDALRAPDLAVPRPFDGRRVATQLVCLGPRAPRRASSRTAVRNARNPRHCTGLARLTRVVPSTDSGMRGAADAATAGVRRRFRGRFGPFRARVGPRTSSHRRELCRAVGSLDHFRATSGGSLMPTIVAVALNHHAGAEAGAGEDRAGAERHAAPNPHAATSCSRLPERVMVVVRAGVSSPGRSAESPARSFASSAG